MSKQQGNQFKGVFKMALKSKGARRDVLVEELLDQVMSKGAAGDPSEIATDLIQDTDTVQHWHKELVREFNRAQKDLKFLQRIGAGDTESLNLLREIILPAVKRQRDNYDAAVDQIVSLLRSHRKRAGYLDPDPEVLVKFREEFRKILKNSGYLIKKDTPSRVVFVPTEVPEAEVTVLFDEKEARYTYYISAYGKKGVDWADGLPRRKAFGWQMAGAFKDHWKERVRTYLWEGIQEDLDNVDSSELEFELKSLKVKSPYPRGTSFNYGKGVSVRKYKLESNVKRPTREAVVGWLLANKKKLAPGRRRTRFGTYENELYYSPRDRAWVIKSVISS